MGIINRILNGKLNLDTQPFRVPAGDFIEALNVTRDAPGEGQDIVITNVIGNELVDYSLPSGTNKVIGKFPDKVRNRIYIAVWNSNDYDLWLYYDKTTDTIIKIVENLTDTASEDVLAFDPSYKINHIDIIYRDTYGDLIFYTDGHVTPRKFNVEHLLNNDYSVVKTAFIEAAKAPFLNPPTVAYGSDATRNSNSLRRTLFQFCQRPQYDDYEKGVFFSFSKVPLPVGYYGSDNNIDNTKNNFITVTVDTGDENVIAVEIGMRYSIGNNWSDVVLVAALNKEQLNIPDNANYDFLFYNDTIYPTVADGVQYVDGVQVIPLFFWVPQLAYCQALANGNVPVYAAIKEGYNSFPISELDITITAENKTNVPPDTDPPAISYIQAGTLFTFTVSGVVPIGVIYTVAAYVNFPFPGFPTSITLAQYTSILGDSTDDVATGMYNYIATNNPTLAGGTALNTFGAILPAGSSILHIGINAPSPGAGTISTEKTWMQDCPYAYGLVYFDEQGRDMPGVITYSNPIDSDNDFLLTTPSFSLSGANRQTPVVSASINHLPPEGAVAYCWVRRRLQYSNPIEYMTCDFDDTLVHGQPPDGFYYFCLDNVEAYKEANSQFIYGTALPENPTQSRIKVIAGVSGGSYNGNIWNQDYEIAGIVTKTITGGTSPGDDKTFIKVKIPDSLPSPTYSANMLVMVYTPTVNPTNLSDSTYLEWGETYNIYELDGVNYHRGLDQDQTASQPATFTWPEGDVYYHQRNMYSEILTDPFDVDTLNIMDINFSDFFDSAVNDNGRAQAIEVNAQQIYNHVLLRFGGAYQSGTTVNNTPDFYFENQQEADRGWADIEKIYIRNRYMYVLHKFKIGVIPILLQIVRDTAGNPLEANSDILLNKINYPYNEDVGIGDVPESFASDKDAMYGVDDYRGVVWRLSQNGITILSVLYECNSFFVPKLKYYRKSLNNGYAPVGEPYTGDPSVYGVFDAFTNKYILALEEINRYDQFAAPTPAPTTTLISGEPITGIGTFSYKITFGGADSSESSPSAASTPIVLGDFIHIIQLTNIPISTNSRVTKRNIYRDINGDNNFLLIATLEDNVTTTYNDNISAPIGGNPNPTNLLVFHQDPYTISFNEVRNTMEGFESSLSYHPEMMVCLDTQLFAFKNGATWKFTTDAPHCNYFGVQYDAYITIVFNDNGLEKKSWMSLTQLTDTVWECPQISTNSYSYGSTKQLSKLIPENFRDLEGDKHSSILRDLNSRGGWVNGDFMKGNYIVIKFLKQNASDLVYLNGVSVFFKDSPLTNK